MKAAAIILGVWAALIAFAVALFYVAGEDEQSRAAWQEWEDMGE